MIYEQYTIIFHNTSFYQKITYSKQIVYIIALSILGYYYQITGIALAFLIRALYDFTLNYIYANKVKE